MRTLIVTAHPHEDSLCFTLAQFVVDKLASQGHEVILEDLYANNFDPVLTSQERASYYAQSYDTTRVKAEIDRLKNTEYLVLVFPTWWFGFPAMLKGWFDRVWAPTVAYDHATDFGPIQPKLVNLRRVLVITTLGAPWWVDFFILWRPVKKVIRFGLIGACARSCKLQYISFYKCEKLDNTRVELFKKKISKLISQ